jgi:hypothetical protein
MTAQGESRNESNEAPRLIRNAAGGFSTVWPDGAEYEVCTKDSPLELAITAFVSEIPRSIEDTVELPKMPPEAWFRPFIMCPADEVLLAWQAFLKIAERMRGSIEANRQGKAE